MWQRSISSHLIISVKEAHHPATLTLPTLRIPTPSTLLIPLIFHLLLIFPTLLLFLSQRLYYLLSVVVLMLVHLVPPAEGWVRRCAECTLVPTSMRSREHVLSKPQHLLLCLFAADGGGQCGEGAGGECGPLAVLDEMEAGSW